MAEMFRKWEAEDELEEARKRVQVTEEGGEIGEGHTEVDKAPHIPKHFIDMVPTTKDDLTLHIADTFPEDPIPSSPGYRPPTVEEILDEDAPPVWRTVPNEFGVFREYSEPLKYDPESQVTLDPMEEMLDREDLSEEGSHIGPFANKSQFCLYDWWYNSSITKSLEDFNCLIDVLRSRGFSLEDLAGFQAQLAQQKLDDYIHPSGVFSSEDGWRESAVEIPLPKPKVSHTSEAAAPTFTVKGIHHRGLMDIIRGIFEGPWDIASRVISCAHICTCIAVVNGVNGPRKPIHIYTNTYDSDAAREAHETLQQQQRDPNDTPEVPYIIFPLMIGSDATHLTSFGAAATWPFYLYSGALSKYVRGMPSKFTAQHLAYIPSLPDTIQDAYLKAYGTAASADVLTFCKHELMQCVWLLLLDEEFMDTYKNGILVVCGDGVTCRIFPPFHDLLGRLPGKNSCHGTQTPSPAQTDSKQQQRDIKKARKLIFEDGRSLASRRVKDLLDARSLNPIQPAFSVQLSPFGVNVYDLFAPDLMHEFELGVWKGTFTHLLRLVAAQGDDMLKEFNRRMCNMPTFGHDKIRKFWNDVAAQKNLAACDYEDFLVCIMPAFEGLLPLQDDEMCSDLLFELANLHALAKL
ncbi:hypothetical protein C8Q78DRAFT_994357 [Trametes maxima]|nr:hypothetical protein C8Q78DRAFT_994357 [Trametes maxima]